MKSSRIYSGFNERDFCHKNGDEVSILKSSNIKSTCTDSQLDLSGCKILLGKDKMFENIFWIINDVGFYEAILSFY